MTQSRFGTKADITGILALQEPNLVTNMNEEAKKNGFVTTPLTAAMLESLIAEKGVFVAEQDNGKIVGYVLAGDWDFYLQWPIFEYMVTRFPKLSFQGGAVSLDNSFQYGPICLDQAHRGTGLIKSIFEEMRVEWVKRYAISVTFINQANIPSMKAHLKLGWEHIDTFHFGQGTYASLGFDMRISML